MEMLRDRRTRRLSGWEKAAMVLGVMVLLMALLPSPAWVKTYLIQSGYMAMSTEPGEKAKQLLSASLQAPLNLLKADNALPLLRLDIKYQDWIQLSADRDTALVEGVIPQDRKTVRATVYFDQQKFKAKVRLQGDMLDHIKAPNRWSLRLQLDKKQAILSSRRFALVSSDVRIHQGPTLFTQTMKLAGFDIIAPTHTPVRVVVNGDDWGVMLFEQAFSQELLAINNRTEGLITRLELDGEYKDPQGNLIRALRPRVLQRNTILDNPSLRRQRTLALTLINDFLAGKRPPSDVFDAVKMGQYLATVDAWGAWHALTWNNWRWYYNPHTARLEPIQSDVAVVPAPHIWLMKPPSDAFLLSRMMLEDAAIADSYQQALQQLSLLEQSGKLITGLQQAQETFRRQLYASSPLVGQFDFSVLSTQLSCLSSDFTADSCATIAPMDPALHSHFDRIDAIPPWDLASNMQSGQTQHTLTIHNPQPTPVNLVEIQGTTRFDEQTELEGTGVPLPYRLLPGESVSFSVPAKYPSTTLFAGTESQSIAPYEFSLLPKAGFLPRPVNHSSSPYAFIEVNDKGWRFKPGSWHIDKYLVTPADWRVEIPAGTELSFAADGGMMIFGQLQLQGSQDKPVQMFASQPEKGWQGLTLIGKPEQESTLHHLIVRDATSPKQGNWRPRGAVYLVNTQLDIEGLEVTDNRSEDALNIINSQVDIRDLVILNALSDAFDCDFCVGEVNGGQFTNIGKRSGGDGIDVSGSRLTIRDVHYTQVRDKAISAGENSHLSVSNCSFNDVNFALVSKDASHIDGHNLRLENIRHYALMSYSKKPFFGAATMSVSQIECLDFKCDSKAKVALRSLLMLEGRSLTPEVVDVKNLYRTVMKSDKPQ